MGPPTILATSTDFRTSSGSGAVFSPLMLYAVELAGVAGRAPRMCFLDTARGDQLHNHQAAAEAARNAGVELSSLHLSPRPPTEDLTAYVGEHDVVWVNGGSVVNLLAVWRAHRLDDALYAAWRAGVVLAGTSAGSICWHTGGTTDSHHTDLDVVSNGLGFIPFANGVHHSDELARRPVLHAAVSSGTLGVAHCTDDGAGLVYHGSTLVGVVAEHPRAGAYKVHSPRPGVVLEEPLGATQV